MTGNYLRIGACFRYGVIIIMCYLPCSYADEIHFQQKHVDTADVLADRALTSERAYTLVESLTTEVGARLAGTEADKKAVLWAKSTLEKSGFDRIKLEPVSFPVWERVSETAEIISPFPQQLLVSALGFSGSTKGTVTAEVIEFPSLLALEQAKADKLAGKIVFINRKMHPSITGWDYGDSVAIRYQGHKVAREKGAIAVLIRSLGTSSHRFPHTGAMTYDEHNGNLPAAALSTPDADQLERVIAAGKPVQLALNIKTSLMKEGGSHNVVADIIGREKPEEIILLGAHLDSWDLGTGAIDDGAGVAIVISAAELIASLPKRPRRTIRVVLFANEEQGGWGAKAYARDHADELKNHIIAVESDFGAKKIWQLESLVPEAMLPLISSLSKQLISLGVQPGGNSGRGGPDLAPLKLAKVPILALNQDGTDYFRHHHTANDVLDRIDIQSLQQNVAVYSKAAYFLSEYDW